MMNRDDMPFFIHSYQHRDTLPEPLNVCSRICHMFDTRTPEIMPFIWRCIRSEELRFLNDVGQHLLSFLLLYDVDVYQPLSKEELLAASQAQIIYIMMMVIDSGLRRLEWVQEILMLSGVSLIENNCMSGRI
jgi:hypothetical protein